MHRDEVLSRLRERIAGFAASRPETAGDLAKQVITEIERNYDPAQPAEDMVPLALQTLLGGGTARDEMLERLAEAIPRLDERCRELLRLKLLGRSFPQIQEELDADSVDAVYDRDFRCRRKLMPAHSARVGGLLPTCGTKRTPMWGRLPIGSGLATRPTRYENFCNLALVGGYATGNLTPEERQRLFRAALDDPAVFEALAAEEPLRELLEDGAARARLVEATGHRDFSMRSLFLEWLDRPRSRILVAAGLVALAAVGIRTVWERYTPPLDYIVLRSGPGEPAQPVPPGYRFRPEDRVGLRIQPERDGRLEVRDDSGNLIYSGTPAAGESVIIPAQIPFGDAEQRSFDLRTRDASIQVTLKGRK